MLLFLHSQDGEEGSIADMLRATAEQAMTQTGFVFDETTGMYYDHSTKFYYDSVGYKFSIIILSLKCILYNHLYYMILLPKPYKVYCLSKGVHLVCITVLIVKINLLLLRVICISADLFW